jgi:formylglycine-generating enzyme required for sulfatase activity
MGFVELVGLAELDPATAFRGAVLRGSMRGQDLAGFDFTGAEFRGCDLTGANLSRTVGVTPEMLATAIADNTTVLPRPHFWKDERAPFWAEDWGHDAYGPWVMFRVPDTDVTQRMRWCPPGEFMMGSPEGEEGRSSDESPRHRVVLKQGFWMFDTACTEMLWFAVMRKRPRKPRGNTYPATGVNWDEARDFVQRLNVMLPGLALDLPSEAEWEYACRAGTDTPYNFGSRLSKKRVCYGGATPVKVGTLPPSPWGLFEMHGNVWEWCLDYALYGYRGAPKDGSAWLDRDGAPSCYGYPGARNVGSVGLGPDGGPSRVARGGAWVGSPRSVRAACRFHVALTARGNYLGFRCIRTQRDGKAEPLVGRSELDATSGRRRRRRRRGGES